MLFKDVTNSAEIHKKLLDRTLEPEVALLDPAPIQSLFALHLAAHKAVVDARAEVPSPPEPSTAKWCTTCPRRNTSRKVFDVSEWTTTRRRCWRVASTRRADGDAAATKANVGGTLVPSGELEAALAAMSDAAKVKKYYRPGELEVKEGVGTVEDAVISRIGAREVL